MSVEHDPIANAANLSAFIFENVSELNWVGFYFLKTFRGEEQLVLGPFQGKAACTRIAIGRGVCGRSYQEKTVMNVPDVHAVLDHIACDQASESEFVVPLYKNAGGIGVFDVDSPRKARFDSSLGLFLESAAEIYINATDFSGTTALFLNN